jgi:hypothetical protein
METYGVTEGIAPQINFGTRFKTVIRYTLQSLFLVQ